VPLAAAYDLGLSTDGTALYVLTDTTTSSSSTGTVATFDPATLVATGPSPVTTNGFLPSFSDIGFGVVATNDGRGWLGLVSIAGGQFGEAAYVTTGNLLPTVVMPTNSTMPISPPVSFYGAPFFAASRDGELLVLTQDAGETPQAPMLYLHSKDDSFNTIAPGPNNTNFSYEYSLSETGDRVLFNNSELRDGSFNIVGNATIPTQSNLPMGVTSYFAINAQVAQLTPDGKRLYVLTYPYTNNGPIGSVPPRIFVFDAQTTSTNLNVLGYFDIADYPSCLPDAITCYSNGASAISLDGKTLFFAGDKNFIVVPVPATLNTVSAAPSGPTAQALQHRGATPWPLNLH
jgi:hypothetical protein